SSRRTVRQIAPLILAGVEDVDLFVLRDVAYIFQEVIKEWQLEMLAIINASLHSKVSRAQPIAISPSPTSVTPRPHHEHVKDSRVLLFDTLLSSQRAN